MRMSYISSVLQLINKAEVTQKLKMCFSFFDTIDFRGHVIPPRPFHIATRTTSAVRDLKWPSTTSKLRLLLRLCNVYCRLVSKFS